MNMRGGPYEWENMTGQLPDAYLCGYCGNRVGGSSGMVRAMTAGVSISARSASNQRITLPAALSKYRVPPSEKPFSICPRM